MQDLSRRFNKVAEKSAGTVIFTRSYTKYNYCIHFKRWRKSCKISFKVTIMNLPDDSKLPKYSQEEEINSPDIIERNEELEGDTDPPLDEEDLEENNLTVEEADQIEWEPAKKGSSGTEEKDITAHLL